MDNSKVVKDFLIFSEFLSSSSDEDDEEQFCVLNSRGVIPKMENFVKDVVYKFDNKQFKRNFRLEWTTAETIFDMFKKSEFCPRREHGGRDPISAETHILSFLWFAANKTSIRAVALLFNMTESSFLRVSERVMDFLMDLAPSVIKMPNTLEEKEFLEEEFKKISGIPGVLGVIDGSSININTPPHKIKSTYVNRHDQPAITLQGICDYRRRFIDVFSGVPGKVHDARVYKMSDISAKIPTLCGDRYHLLGDGAYSLRSWLLTPYKNFGRLTREEETFNKKFSATRVLIENSFGILKGRFRQLLLVDMRSVSKTTKFIICCCVLHNICIDCDDALDERDYINEEDGDDQLPIRETEAVLRRRGEDKRDFIKNSFRYV